MIDTHSHILPNLDDGTRDISESISVVKEAARQGVDTIFATPHSYDGVFDCKKDKILKRCQELSTALETRGILTRILPGSEVQLQHDLVREMDAGHLVTINNCGRWILLELPPIFMADAIKIIFRQLKERGVTPIIAHAERNGILANKQDLLVDLINYGGKIQITAGSLMGDFGKAAMKAAENMLGRDQVFCLGSDFHPGRKYRMKAAEKKLIKIIGKNKTSMIVRENPNNIIFDNYKSLHVQF